MHALALGCAGLLVAAAILSRMSERRRATRPAAPTIDLLMYRQALKRRASNRSTHHRSSP